MKNKNEASLSFTVTYIKSKLTIRLKKIPAGSVMELYLNLCPVSLY